MLPDRVRAKADSDGNLATAYRVKDACFFCYSDLTVDMDTGGGVPRCLGLASQNIYKKLQGKIWGTLKTSYTTVGSDYPLTRCVELE